MSVKVKSIKLINQIIGLYRRRKFYNYYLSSLIKAIRARKFNIYAKLKELQFHKAFFSGGYLLNPDKSIRKSSKRYVLQIL